MPLFYVLPIAPSGAPLGLNEAKAVHGLIA
jgi:hypothetical protein